MEDLHWTAAVRRWERDPSRWSPVREETDDFQRVRRLEDLVPAPLLPRIAAWLAERGRAVEKWPHLEDPFFDRLALAQGSSTAVGRARARRIGEQLRDLRFEHGAWVDLGCGAGGEFTAWIAESSATVATVHAVERDEERARLAEANRGRLRPAFERDCATFVHALDAASASLRDLLAEAAVLFCDPSRRDEQGRRSARSLEDASPGPALLAELAARAGGRLVVKAAPACEQIGALEQFTPERSSLSLDGEMKETTLWCGPLRRAARSACVLPSGEWLYDHELPAVSRIAAPSANWRAGDLLYVADVAVRRAALVPALESRLDAATVAGEAGLLHAHRAAEVATGRGHLVRAHAIERVLPADRRSLARALRELRGTVRIVRQAGTFRPGSALQAQLHDLAHAPLTKDRTLDPELVLLASTLEGRPAVLLTRSRDEPRPR